MQLKKELQPEDLQEQEVAAASISPSANMLQEGIGTSVIPAEDLQKVDKLPSSNIVKRAFDTLSYGEKNLADYSTRKGKVSHSSKIKLDGDGDKRRIQIASSNSEVTLSIDNIKAIRKNKAAKKLFIFFLIKVNQQAFHKGKLTQDYISFQLRELIERGYYSKPQSARVGINTAMPALRVLSAVENPIGTRKELNKPLFGQYDIDDAQCKIYLWPAADWPAILQYFTFLPSYYGSLSSKGGDLLINIVYLARMPANIKSIRDRGYFTMGFKNIHAILQLPSSKGNRKPGETIRKPMQKAWEEINAAQWENYHNKDLELVPVFDDNAGIEDFLENGCLRVYVRGSFIEDFLELYKKRTRKIEAQAKRKEKITDNAKAINLAKKLKEKEEAGE